MNFIASKCSELNLLLKSVLKVAEFIGLARMAQNMQGGRGILSTKDYMSDVKTPKVPLYKGQDISLSLYPVGNLEFIDGFCEFMLFSIVLVYYVMTIHA